MSKAEQIAFKIPKKFCATEHNIHTSLDTNIRQLPGTFLPALQAAAAETTKSQQVKLLEKRHPSTESFPSTTGRLSPVDITSEINQLAEYAKNMRVSEVEIPRRSRALLVEDNKINMKASHQTCIGMLLLMF